MEANISKYLYRLDADEVTKKCLNGNSCSLGKCKFECMDILRIKWSFVKYYFKKVREEQFKITVTYALRDEQTWDPKKRTWRFVHIPSHKRIDAYFYKSGGMMFANYQAYETPAKAVEEMISLYQSMIGRHLAKNQTDMVKLNQTRIDSLKRFWKDRNK